MERENGPDNVVNGIAQGARASSEQVSPGAPREVETPAQERASTPQEGRGRDGGALPPRVSVPPENTQREDARQEQPAASPGGEGAGAGCEGETRTGAAGAPRRKARAERAEEEPVQPEEEAHSFTGEEKLLLLDVWEKSGLAAGDFCTLVRVSAHSLYSWRKKVDEAGPEGLFPRVRGAEPGAKVDAATRRAIVMLRQGHPEYGCQRISDILYRGPGVGVSPKTVARVLEEEGLMEERTEPEPHPDKPRSFERAKPMQLWQSDLFTFVLKRQAQRVHLVAFLDDHSRYVTGFGVASRASGEFVIEVVRTAIGAYGPPEEMLTDQGPQYNTWRGKSLFSKEMEKRGIKHIMARARHPQTLGKVERFWGSLWRECLESAVFIDMEDARRRIAFYMDHYNFQRPHQSLGGLVPADRFFSADSEVRKTLQDRVSPKALDLAKNGAPRKTFYLTGRVGDVGLSLHTEGEKVVMTTGEGKREEVDLRPTGRRDEGGGAMPEPVSAQGVAWGPEPAALPAEPGASRLDEGLERLRDAGLAADDGESEVR